MKMRIMQSVMVILFALLAVTQGVMAHESPMHNSPVVEGVERIVGKDVVLEDIKLSLGKEEIVVDFRFDGEISYTSFLLTDPLRVVIEIPNGKFPLWFSQLGRKDWLFKHVRIFDNRWGLRIVAEMQMDGPDHQLSWLPETLTLRLKIPRRFTILEREGLAEGVEYVHIKRGLPEGLAQGYALNVQVPQMPAGRNLIEQLGWRASTPQIQLKTAYRTGDLKGFSKVSDLVKREQAFAGINGGYFGGDGYPLGLLVKDNRLISQPLFNRTAWGIDVDGQMRMGQVSLIAEVALHAQVYQFSGYNRPRAADEMVVYTSDYGKTTKTNEWGLEVVVKNNRVQAIQTHNSTIPEDGWVISGHGKYKELLKSLRVGDHVDVQVRLTPDWLTERVEYAVGGGPRLVKDGRIFITGEEEKFKADILQGRAPRTALGISEEQHLMMVVIDGRQKSSIGMSLQELAELMRNLGAKDAMNLDGGKSSTLVIGDRIYNSPSAGEEISVHNGLLLFVAP